MFRRAEQRRTEGIGRRLPYGIDDLDPQVAPVDGTPKRVRCYVRGCGEVLQVPNRFHRGEPCPVHGIRCHLSGGNGTYTYTDVRRNIIASPRLLADRIVHHSFKYESHRLGAERSEDALTWNVFRSLQEAGCLGRIAEFITGDTTPIEPFLYLWGICLTDNEFEPWDLLVAARERFEPALPVVRPLTEPDIALHLPGKYLILIEAKFTSANTLYQQGPRKNASSLTLDELLGIYHDPTLRILDYNRAHSAARIYQQLWRNTVFAEWMAREDHPQTNAYHVNLVRAGADEESAREFHGLVRSEFEDRFQRLTWEGIYALCSGVDRLADLRKYLETKTAGLARAFRLPAADSGSAAS
jgi:hypothetical protein